MFYRPLVLQMNLHLSHSHNVTLSECDAGAKNPAADKVNVAHNMFQKNMW